MSRQMIRVSEAEAASDFPSLLALVRAGAEVVIERNTESRGGDSPGCAPRPSALESRRLAEERGSSATLDGDFGRECEAVISSYRNPLTTPALD